MTEKFSALERENLRQVILECELQRFSTQEALNYIKSKLKQPISEDYYYTMKRKVREESKSRLNDLIFSKDSYLQEMFFGRVDELVLFQREAWKIHNENPNRPETKLRCLSELRLLTESLSNMYMLLPDLVPIQLILNENKKLKENENKLSPEERKRLAMSSREAKF